MQLSIYGMQHIAMPQPIIAVDQIFYDFLKSQEINNNSKATYLRQIRQFIQWLQDTGKQYNQLDTQDVLTYKEYLMQQGKSSYTISGYLAVTRKFYEWLESKKIYPNIARSIKGPKKARGFRKDCLTSEQINLVLQKIDRSTLTGLRNFALINLMARTGLRTIEISRASISDMCQQSGESILWIQGKGRDAKDDFVLLIHEAMQPLREYLSKRGRCSESEPLFADIYKTRSIKALTPRMLSKIVKESLKSAGLDDKRLSAHSLRHTAISLSIKGGASLIQAQAMARHSDPKTTMIYFHNQARIQAGAEKFIKF